MGKRPKQTFLQRRYTECQQTHERMLNIISDFSLIIREMQMKTTMSHIFFIHSSVDGHLGCFHVLDSTERSTWCFVTTWKGGWEGDARGRRYGDICIRIADSLCYKAETNTPL